VAPLRDNLNSFVRQFALALQRVTRLNAAGGTATPEAPDEDLLRTSTRHLPGAGWLVGLLCAFVFAVVALALRGNPGAPAVAAVAAVIAAALLTGAVQESGFYRMADGLDQRGPGGRSRAGHGAIALVLLLAGRMTVVAALGAQSEAGVLAALFAAPVISRFAPLLAAHWVDHQGDVDGATVRIAALWCVLPLLLMVLAEGVVFLVLALLLAAIAWVAMLRFFRNRPARFGEERAAGVQQVCEAAFYLGAAIGA
jgi:adenosylcobinamide-GDP ribazoletransferase